MADIARTMNKLKSKWAGHICRTNDARRSSLNKRSIGRHPARWSDDLCKIADGRWMRILKGRAKERKIGEVYGQQWSTIGR